MIFVNPIMDTAFKKLFSNEKHLGVLIDFLNSILNRKEGEKIVSVIINDPYNLHELVEDKMSIVDVSCTDQKGNNYIIEMQARPQNNFLKRALFYSAFALRRQIAAGESYSKLAPVIFIGVLDFELLKNPHYISHHTIRDTATNECEVRDLEFYFIELPKFKKTIDQLENSIDNWVYLLQNAVRLHSIPDEFKDKPVLQEAFDILERANWTEQELFQYESKLKQWRNAQSEFETAIEKAKYEKARAMFKEGLTTDQIAKVTKLTIEELEELKSK